MILEFLPVNLPFSGDAVNLPPPPPFPANLPPYPQNLPLDLPPSQKIDGEQNSLKKRKPLPDIPKPLSGSLAEGKRIFLRGGPIVEDPSPQNIDCGQNSLRSRKPLPVPPTPKPLSPPIGPPTDLPPPFPGEPPTDLPPLLPTIKNLELFFREFHKTEIKFNDYLKVRRKLCKFFTEEKIDSLARRVSKKSEHKECYRHLKNLFNEDNWLKINRFSNKLNNFFNTLQDLNFLENVNECTDILIFNLNKISKVTDAFSAINVAIARSIYFVDSFKTSNEHPWKTVIKEFKNNGEHPVHDNLDSISKTFIATTQRLVLYKVFIENMLAMQETKIYLKPKTLQKLNELLAILDKNLSLINEKQREQDHLFENWKIQKKKSTTLNQDDKVTRKINRVLLTIKG